MKTLFLSGPGLVGGQAGHATNDIPIGCTRMYLARIEVLDLEAGDEIQFQPLIPMAQGNIELTKALIAIGAAVRLNQDFLANCLREG